MFPDAVIGDRKCTRCVALIALCISTLSVPADPAVHARGRAVLVLVAGQSNAVGYNDYREYPPELDPVPSAWRDQPGVLFWNEAAGSWTNLRAGASGGHGPFGFGPEIGLSLAVARRMTNAQLAIVKYAVGGTGIARSRAYTDYIPSLRAFDDQGRNWHPATQDQPAGALYQELIRIAARARSALEQQGYSCEWEAVVWMQGEHEAGISPGMAADYGDLLSAFMRALRADLVSPGLPFLVGEVNGHAWAFGKQVRRLQAEVCAADGSATLVRTTDLSRIGSGGAAHFDAASMIELGQRFARALEEDGRQGRTDE